MKIQPSQLCIEFNGYAITHSYTIAMHTYCSSLHTRRKQYKHLKHSQTQKEQAKAKQMARKEATHPVSFPIFLLFCHSMLFSNLKYPHYVIGIPLFALVRQSSNVGHVSLLGTRDTKNSDMSNEGGSCNYQNKHTRLTFSSCFYGSASEKKHTSNHLVFPYPDQCQSVAKEEEVHSVLL